MNVVEQRPVLAWGTIAGVLSAAWLVVVDAGVLSFVPDSAQTSLSALVALLIPIAATYLAERLVTTVAAPNLPVGTIVNANSTAPTSVVEEQ